MKYCKYILLLFCLCCSSALAQTCLPSTQATFSSDGKSVLVSSSKDLSNVVLVFCDGSTDFKFDGLSGKELTFTKDKKLSGVYIKSGCNSSDAGPGYGEFHSNDCGEVDCLGVPGGEAKEDLCGVCDGDNSCVDCKGVPFGSAVIDECGVCDGHDQDKGCDGICFSQTSVDECGVCGGVGKSGCDNSCGSVSVLDVCGVCAGDGQSCVKRDCSGEVNGTKVEDVNGICCEEDQIDECGLCGGPGKDSCDLCPSDPDYGTGVCNDCAGVPNGSAEVDSCGVCEGDDTSCNCGETGCNPVEIDTLSGKQYRLVRKYVNKARKNLGRKGKLKAKQDLQEANHLHMTNWTLIWTEFGLTTYQCTDLAGCERIDLVPTIEEIVFNTDRLFKLARKYIRKSLKHKKKAKRRHIKRAKALKDEIIQESSKLPTFKSVCE